MTRLEAIATIFASCNADDIVVSSTGLISREVYEGFDSERNIYVPGSMGLASSIGLGIALAQPARRIIVIDGDASILMNLGSIVTVGNQKPLHYLHVVLDNGAYGSCSEERSMSDTAQLDRLAVTVGYRYVQRVSSQELLSRATIEFRDGPGFILVQIELGGRRDLRRPLELKAIRDRFRSFLGRTWKG